MRSRFFSFLYLFLFTFMSMAQPFPILNSADNSRAGSPAPSSSASTSKNKKKKKPSRGGNKQPAHQKEKKEQQKSAEDSNKGKSKPNASNKNKQRKGKNNNSRRRNTTSAAATAKTAQPEAPQKQNNNSNELPAGLLVRGENGRARAVFSPANDIEGQYYNNIPHASRRMSLNHCHYSDNSLGISMPMPMPMSAAAAATYVPPPPRFRHRSFTSSQRRISSARMHAPLALAINDDYPVPIQHYQGVPMSAPATNLHFNQRGRSQTVSHNASMTGRHVTMSQAPLGQVLAPPEPRLDNADRRRHPHRDSVPNADLTLDHSNTIRIPTIMLQKASSEEQADDQSGPLTGEKLAMKRLQDMISSMRVLTDTPKSPTLSSPNPTAHPIAHPTARFDSILEEDEDDEHDEAELDKEQEDTNATAAVSC